MKILFALLFTVVALPVFAEPLSDRTGLTTSFPITIESGTFTVQTTSNFDVKSVSFEGGKLVFSINSSLQNNIAEVQIPHGLTSGNLTFSLDGNQITPKILQNEKISFVTLEFAGNGTHTLEVKSDYVPKPVQETPVITTPVVDHSNDLLIILVVVGIVAAGSAATTLAVYFKRRKPSSL